MPAGAWTDDTSMALCLAESLLERHDFVLLDQMERYVRWYRDGHLSSTDHCFDIGATIGAALDRFRQSGNPISGSTSPRSAGNGSIMRLAPVPMFFHPDRTLAVRFSEESSITTHGCTECREACRLMGAQLHMALGGHDKAALLFRHDICDLESDRMQAIARGDWQDKTREQIRGGGYVIDCLEAALWCFFHADSFEEAILAAVNLGDDADTTGAVTGQLAGAYYGIGGIPRQWRKRIVMGNMIENWADRLRMADIAS